MERNLPVFNIAFNPLNSRFNTVSIVEYPATESNFIKFGNDESKLKFSIQNKEKRIICGAVVVPDKLIYRNDYDFGEYYIKFTKETVENMRNKWGESYWKDFTLDHEYTSANLSVVETWIKESETKDKSLLYNLDEPVGTLFMSCKINSDELWQQIEEGKYNGFSVEVYSGLELETPLNDLYKKQNKKTDMQKIECNGKSLLSLSGVNKDGDIDKGNIIYTEDKTPFVGDFEFASKKYKTNDFGQVEEITKFAKSNLDSDKRFDAIELSLKTLQLAIQEQQGQKDNIKEMMSTLQGISTKLSKAKGTVDESLPKEKQEVRLSAEFLENIDDFLGKFNKTSNSYLK